METYVIGIAGGSGSGKTTFARKIQKAYPDSIALVSCDNYYLPQDDVPFSERVKQNYDSPKALELDLMAKHVASLKRGEDVKCPVYDFKNHTRSGEELFIKAKPIIIIDGILLFTNEELRKIMDLKIYVETDADERILRRARRDMNERGRSIDSVIEQYLATVKPMHNAFVEPTKLFADIVINGGMSEIALDLVSAKIDQLLKTLK